MVEEKLLARLRAGKPEFFLHETEQRTDGAPYVPRNSDAPAEDS
jgi:hypothetical protein